MHVSKRRRIADKACTTVLYCVYYSTPELTARPSIGQNLLLGSGRRSVKRHGVQGQILERVSGFIVGEAFSGEKISPATVFDDNDRSGEIE